MVEQQHFQGRATPQGTRRFAQRHANIACRELGCTDLLVSEAGFGGYRIDVTVEEHRHALSAALSQGINLIDTSANYSNGGSELLIGAVLSDLIEKKTIARDEIVIVSKGGYIQGDTYVASQAKQKEGKAYPDLVHYSEGLEHCIHPDFLSDQIQMSQDRLRVECIDVYLLHNPEYYLMWASDKMDRKEAESEYMKRLSQAFAYLETAVEEGKIGCFGVSSNTFGAPDSLAGFTCLSHLIDAAKKTADPHHFWVIQAPCNLFETGLITQANQPDGSTALETAKKHQLGVLVNRPFNAISGHRLIRLTQVNSTVPPDESDIAHMMTDVEELETKFQETIITQLKPSEKDHGFLQNHFLVCQTLSENWHACQGLEQWKEIMNGYFLPRIEAGVEKIHQTQGFSDTAKEWVEHYLQSLHVLFEALTAYYQSRSSDRMVAIQNILRDIAPQWVDPDLFSHQALRALRSCSGISCILVGMRHPTYVADVLSELTTPVTPNTLLDTWTGVEMALKTKLI